MKRDFICCLRLLADSLPKQVRNSRALFKIASFLFDLPPSLFYFRENYKAGLIHDLNSLYKHGNPLCLRQVSQNTDINSLHIRLIKKYFYSLPSGAAVLDAGCGSGYLAGCFSQVKRTYQYVGIDLCANVDKISHCDQERYIQGDLLTELKSFQDKSFDLVVCAHVLEHLSEPSLVLAQLRRITQRYLVVICPLENQYRWGMNYHVHFFSSPEDLIALFADSLGGHRSNTHLKTYTRLGDVMLVEHY